MKASLTAIALLTLAFLVGCGGSSELGRSMPPSKYAPKFPAKVEVPVDQAVLAEAKRQISAAFNSNDPVQKAHAIETIQDAWPDDKDDDVWGAMKDPSPLVRFAAVMAVGHLKTTDAKPELQDLADDPQPIVRVAAIFALHQLGDFTHTKDLEHYSQDLNPDVRGSTALVLGLLGEPSAMNVLNSMKHDESAPVRLQVAESMWRLGNDYGRDVLITNTVSGNPAYQMVAMMGLGVTKDIRIRAHIRSNLTADYPEVCLVAARVMGDLDSEEGYGVAMAGVSSSDARQRSLAALAFGSIGRLDAQPYLSKLLKDSDPEVRIAAATAELELVNLPKQ